MPETALGHFPDVDASYFLSRCPRFFSNDGDILDLRVPIFKCLDLQFTSICLILFIVLMEI